MALVNKSVHIDAIAAGTFTTVTASDSVQTGLREVLYATAQLASDPVLTADRITVTIPSQVSSPGVITIKSWRPTTNLDTTPITATAFSKLVNWIAFGR